MDETDPLLANRMCHRANRALPHLRYRPRSEQGAVAVMFASMLVLIIGFFGLALDLSRIYNRKAELQGVADSVALAAAKKLNGTSGGINDAVAAAHAIVELGDDQFKPKYQYKLTMTWSDAAIKFGRSPDGSTGWLDAGAASISPADIAYVRVDTTQLDPAYGTVDMVFMPVLSSSLTTVKVSQVSVAGRARINVIPLAICAMSPTPAANRSNAAGYEELVEYGFRRGVSYDLMNLNSDSGPPANYLVDPISPAGSASSASNFAVANVGPSVCTGTMAVPKVVGASISVQSGFPIGVLFNHLNSRFDQSGGKCDPNAAPPDTNVRQYVASSLAWMSPKPIYQTAETSTSGGKLQTIADLAPPNNQNPTHYGPLWAFARAVPWSSYTPPEPAAGYAPFAATTTNWAKLYSTGPGPGSYPVGATMTPYFASGSFAQLPSLPHRPGIKFRRVLNVPLLACPISGSTATVLAIGKFFMTVPATASTISAEFAGVANDQQVGGAVEFYQ